MKAPIRLEQALTKLYEAFHHGTLHPGYCKYCAVGNICDNSDTWIHLTDTHGSLTLSFIGQLNENLDRKHFGYLPSELLLIESTFLKACGYSTPLMLGSKKPTRPQEKELLFEGLCATVGLLCKLDNIPNVMDYSKLFEFENDAPVHELADVF
ncbi:MAG: Na(+)-translocating NADH-quinone reductase subunit F [Flavobacteriaceae bacterium]|nr:MAG: Na(+)-translocating NADH-quinone reductase subunit F [Flavobacteriaceae bacterium]